MLRKISKEINQTTLKYLLLSGIFFLLVGSYAGIKDLQAGIFTKIVGTEHIARAKILSFYVIIPGNILYALMVDRLHKLNLLTFYSVLYAVGGLVFALAFGILPWENSFTVWLLTWMFYCAVDTFPVYAVGTFWAITNSISLPEESNKFYGIVVSSSKLGAMLTTALGYYVMMGKFGFDDNGKVKFILYFNAALLVLTPFLIYLLKTRVDQDKMLSFSENLGLEKKAKTDFWEGVRLLFKEPYILGIFATLFFFELMNQVINLQRIVAAEASASGSFSEMTAHLYAQVFKTHFFGFFLALFVSRNAMLYFGVRKLLFVPPMVVGPLLILYFSTGTQAFVDHAYILMHIISYAVATPVREALYIPTTREIQLKAKSWVDSFGAKGAKMSGQIFNALLMYFGSFGMLDVMAVSKILIIFILLLWFGIVFLTGKRYQNSLDKSQPIGSQ